MGEKYVTTGTLWAATAAHATAKVFDSDSVIADPIKPRVLLDYFRGLRSMLFAIA